VVELRRRAAAFRGLGGCGHAGAHAQICPGGWVSAWAGSSSLGALKGAYGRGGSWAAKGVTGHRFWNRSVRCAAGSPRAGEAAGHLAMGLSGNMPSVFSAELLM